MLTSKGQLPKVALFYFVTQKIGWDSVLFQRCPAVSPPSYPVIASKATAKHPLRKRSRVTNADLLIINKKNERLAALAITTSFWSTHFSVHGHPEWHVIRRLPRGHRNNASLLSLAEGEE